MCVLNWEIVWHDFFYIRVHHIIITGCLSFLKIGYVVNIVLGDVVEVSLSFLAITCLINLWVFWANVAACCSLKYVHIYMSKTKRDICYSYMLAVMEGGFEVTPSKRLNVLLLFVNWAFQDVIEVLFCIFLALQFLFFQSTIDTLRLFTPFSSFTRRLALIQYFRRSYVSVLSSVQYVVLLSAFMLVCFTLTCN